MRKRTVEEVEAIVAEAGIALDGPYVGTTQKPTPLRCLTCDHRWEARIANIQQGKGCPDCAGNTPWTVERVESFLSERGLKLDGPYAGAVRKPTPIRCLTCGHRWRARISEVRRGRGCPACAVKRRVKLRCTPIGEVEAIVAEARIALDGPYAGTTHKPTPLRCLTCDHRWEARITSIQQGKGCPNCANTVPWTVERVEGLLAEGGFELDGPYAGSVRKPTPIRCLTCDHRWRARISDIRQGNGCPACARNPWQKLGIYLIRHPETEPHYVGISWKPSLRLEQHRERSDAIGLVARSIDEPYEYTLAEVYAALEAGWEDGSLDEKEYVQNWFIENADGALPPGRLWLPEWDKVTRKQWHEPARVPRFVAEWVEDRMIRYLSVNHPADCPWIAAGQVKLENKRGNAISA